MLDITVVILTKDEKLHIRRCIDNVRPIASEIFVVDSHSTDGTQQIAREAGATVIEHDWPGNQAAQFNWALDNLDIRTEWILRLDADEYLMPELIEELKTTLPSIPADVCGVVFKRRHIFLDKWMKGGIYPVKIMRMFRKGCAVYEQRLMDEHLRLLRGQTHECENDFCDHNLNNLSWFCKKHIDYSVREAAELLDIELGISGRSSEGELDSQALDKRRRKESYARKPLFWRSFAYFIYRYLLKGGWRDGKEGFLFAFLQGWWYRTMADAKVLEIKRKSNGDPEQIKAILKDEYGVSF